MTKLLSEIHWGAVLPCALVYGIFCGVWHRPFLFGKKWEKAMGFKRMIGWTDPPIQFVVPMLASLVTTIAVAMLLQLLALNTFAEVLTVALILGIGFGAPIVYTVGTIPIMHKPLTFGSITGSAQALGITVMTVVMHYLSRWIEGG
ncbi:MAG: DUF1761 domain-containing protein [Cyclobacteriaceae bacterium]|nr:DUF1761 domain-containing protein [Cyclobacteriaceae bacterium]